MGIEEAWIRAAVVENGLATRAESIGAAQGHRVPKIISSKRDSLGRGFVVAFDTTVTLESHVEMAIEGIARQGQQVVVPSLLFSRRSAKSYLIDLRPAALDARGPR